MTQQILHIRTLSEVADPRPTFVAVGSFDGVHLGHQTLIRQMADEARAAAARTAVITFFPHPRRFINGDSGPYYINPLADRLELLVRHGADVVIAHPFDEQVRTTSAADFVDQLVTSLGMRQIWGATFGLGYQREGDIDFLRKEGQQKGFIVRLVPSVYTVEETPISSSLVRHRLDEGDIAHVNHCLGRRHSLSGIVVEGEKRGGCTIGFPTANLDVWDELLLPANGVYATFAELGERRFAAATNIGIRPTVNGRNRTIEAHLLDFDEDIYGQTLRLEFDRRIRPELRFSGLDALRAQIQNDVDDVRASLLDSQSAQK